MLVDQHLLREFLAQVFDDLPGQRQFLFFQLHAGKRNNIFDILEFTLVKKDVKQQPLFRRSYGADVFLAAHYKAGDCRLTRLLHPLQQQEVAFL